MNFTRRGFLGSILALGAAPAIVRADSLMRIIVPTTEEVVAIVGGNRILTIQMITAEALRILHENMQFVQNVNTEFLNAGDVLTIRRPAIYERR